MNQIQVSPIHPKEKNNNKKERKTSFPLNLVPDVINFSRTPLKSNKAIKPADLPTEPKLKL